MDNEKNCGHASNEKSKVATGVLGIVFGSIGIHKFYLGYFQEGLIMVAVTFCSALLHWYLVPNIVGIIGFIEGLIYLTKSDNDFYHTYVLNHKSWF